MKDFSVLNCQISFPSLIEKHLSMLSKSIAKNLSS